MLESIKGGGGGGGGGLVAFLENMGGEGGEEKKNPMSNFRGFFLQSAEVEGALDEQIR